MKATIYVNGTKVELEGTPSEVSEAIMKTCGPGNPSTGINKYLEDIVKDRRENPIVVAPPIQTPTISPNHPFFDDTNFRD